MKTRFDEIKDAMKAAKENIDTIALAMAELSLAMKFAKKKFEELEIPLYEIKHDVKKEQIPKYVLYTGIVFLSLAVIILLILILSK